MQGNGREISADGGAIQLDMANACRLIALSNARELNSMNKPETERWQ